MIYETALVPIIVALVSVGKKAGLPAKFSSLLALALGIGGAFATMLTGDATIIVIVMTGIGLGLMASGLYSGGKAIIKKTPIDNTPTPSV